MRKRVAILGSTGSIGTQALEVIDAHPNLFEVEVLTANNSVDQLILQAKKHQPNIVIIGNKEKYAHVKEALSNDPIKVYAGMEAIEQVAAMLPLDIVLVSMVGFSGLVPTLRAIEAGNAVALANKETLVVAGEIIMELAMKNRVPVIPVDSEHSAIFQCLQGEADNPIEKVVLTASGGPFRGKSLDFLAKVTPSQALEHPNWKMGNKITIDSATLMNKGLEAIEAKWLFNIQPDQVEVVVHPQSIIHSLVQFTDGSIKAQMGLPDMKLPIQYALGYPNRLANNFPRFNFAKYPVLTFEAIDDATFNCLSIAFEAMRKGGNVPCIMNAANEVAVSAFLKGECGFLQIAEVIERTIDKCTFINRPSLNDYLQSDNEARQIASALLKSV